MSNKVFQTLDPHLLEKYGIPPGFSPQLREAARPSNGTYAETKLKLLCLDALQKEMEAYMGFLETEISDPQNDFHMKSIQESVLTPDGFPRNDLNDLVLIQFIKNNWNCVHNDYLKLREHLYETLNEFHSLGKPDQEQQDAVSSDTRTQTRGTPQDPFLKIDSVVVGGAADLAGLQNGDLVLSIQDTQNKHRNDSITWNKKSFNSIPKNLRLLRISEFFKNNLNNDNIHVSIKRQPGETKAGVGSSRQGLSAETVIVDIQLTPKLINGSILGCKLCII
ncbi:hypothetical protein AWRI3579_g3700 [Hanseniaspora osmophila]|uniref:Nas2 N-terminal domain-containing protein n=1 Tax=Hanseniaspora osmophila TaxID=56408 RepID=A0A1E5R4V0_9ASCO|nr:hypothetical protein AWRI3579_g3700 [Hanseniaspora osmophila]